MNLREFNAKAILVKEQQWHYLTAGIRVFMPFPKVFVRNIIIIIIIAIINIIYIYIYHSYIIFLQNIYTSKTF